MQTPLFGQLAEPQQTLFTQLNPDEQPALLAHDAPRDAFGTHVEPEQKYPAAQSVERLQVDLQAVEPHA